MKPIIAADLSDLKISWANLRGENPSLRIREAAKALNVSEAELLATGIGENVTRLKPKFAEILQELPALGRVMALTRNDEIVHERKGEYAKAEVIKGHRQMGLVLGDDIDLRIFFDHWHLAFAVTDTSPRGATHSFQFFDADGSAVHKVFLTATSELTVYKKLVEKYRCPEQSQKVNVESKPAVAVEKDDAEIDVEGFRAAWANLKDTHDFFPLLRKFGVAREQALRLADDKMTRRVRVESYKSVLENAAERVLPIMIFVGNAGIIQIHTGVVERIVEARGWFNILDERFNLHINQEKIARAWIVKKPTGDGIVTSLELFNEMGENLAFFFGKRKPGFPEDHRWRELLAEIETI